MYKLLLTLLIVGFVGGVYSVRCWKCRSDWDEKCGDPFNNRSITLIDCSFSRPSNYPNAQASFCHKIVKKEDGEKTISRDCAFSNEGEDPCEKVDGKCFACSEDGCNGSTRDSSAAALLALLASLSVSRYIQLL